MSAEQSETPAMYMTVRQVAAYLRLNEKKIYALVGEGRIPATKITGKWLFPRELVDRWVLDSAHGGLLADRLLIAGSDDPLLYRLVLSFARHMGTQAQISYTPTGTRRGLELLQAGRVDVGAVHWGPDVQARTRHPALLRQYPQHRDWALIRAFRREQGLMIGPRARPDADCLDRLVDARCRWAQRQRGSGAQRYLLAALDRMGIAHERLPVTLTALSEREAAAAIALGQADVAPGARAAAAEFGLGFVPLGWEAFDFALSRGVWFRRLFQDLMHRLKDEQAHQWAAALGGYDLGGAGDLVWGDD